MGNRLDLEQFRDIQDKPGREACSKFDSSDINESVRNGYKSLFWETTSNNTTGYSRAVCIICESYGMFQYPISIGQKEMEKIFVCDTRWKEKEASVSRSLN